MDARVVYTEKGVLFRECSHFGGLYIIGGFCCVFTIHSPCV